VHRNFHAVFAVGAAFANQAIYRLPELQQLDNMELLYTNPDVVEKAEEDAKRMGIPTPPPQPAAANGETPAAGWSVQRQYRELKTFTSSRNNYGVYRQFIGSLLGDSVTAAGLTPAASSTQLSGEWAGTTPAPSTPLLPQSHSASRESSRAATPAPELAVAFPSAAQGEFNRAFPLLADSSTGSNGTGAADSNGVAAAADTAPSADIAAAAASVTLVPHLAVHLKDLVYSQELSGIELQWMEEPLKASVIAAAAAVPGTPARSPATPAAAAAAVGPSSSLLSCRFDRSRWQRTSRLLFQLLRFQSLPVFRASSLSLHCPALYTLLQVHLLTHVLPESELLQLSFGIQPKVDRQRQQQVQIKKKTLSALQEEGFM